MSDLVEFLLARIEEDEARVSQAIGVQPWAINPPNLFHGIAVRHLGDCEAKRRIVEQVRKVEWAGYGVRDFILEHLALPYADHPDYREAWKP